MLRRTWIGLLAIISLGSCGTPAQRQYQAIVANNQMTVEQAIICATAVYNAPETAPLRPHVPLDPRQASLAQISDPNYPNPEEIAAILAGHPRLKACQQQALDGVVRSTPRLVPVLSQAYAEGDNDTVLLTQRKLTWGQSNTRRRDRALTMQAAIIAEADRVTAGLQQQHALQQQQQIEAQQQLLGTAAYLDAISRPSRLPPGAYQLPGSGIMNTNCTRYGNQTQCQSIY